MAVETEAIVRQIPIESATAANVAPFGTIVGPSPDLTPTPSAFYDRKVHNYPPVNFVSDDDTELIVSRLDYRGLRARWMERHFKHTQVFIPLSGKPMLLIMAPPNDKDLPDLDQVKALRFDGTAAFMLRVGTWHEFPLALEDNTNLVVILRRETYQSLKPSAVVDGEGQGPDLDKKDIVRRMGVILEAVPAT